MKAKSEKAVEATTSSDSWAPSIVVLVPFIAVFVLAYLAHEAGFDELFVRAPVSTMCDRGC